MCPGAKENGMCEFANAALWRQVYGERLDSLSDRQVEMNAQLQENTEATQRIEASTGELVTMLESWKGAMRVLEMIGKVAKPIGMIATACAAVWGFMHMGAPK